MPFILPTGPLPPTEKNPRVLLLYSQPKCGKTTSVATLPNSILFEIDPKGSAYISAPRVELKNAPEFRLLCDQIIQAGRPYKYGIIDHLGPMDDWMVQEATEDFKRTTLGVKYNGNNILNDLPNGGGYRYYWDCWTRHLHKFFTCFPYVILLAHVRDKFIASGDREEDIKVETKLNKQAKVDTEVKTTDVDLTGKLRNIICGRADAIGYMMRDRNQKLWISFDNSTMNSESRAKHLTGNMIELGDPVGGFAWNKVYID